MLKLARSTFMYTQQLCTAGQLISSSFAAKPTANDMQHLAQPSHRRFELTATAKHANSPFAQVKAYNSKVLQTVQSSHGACRDDKMLRPVRNSVEVQPLSSAKPSRKLSLDGFLEMCKSKSGTVSRGAHTGVYVCVSLYLCMLVCASMCASSI